MAYKLEALNENQKVIMKADFESKVKACIAYDIWTDWTLDESGEIAEVRLIDLKDNRVVLSERRR